MRRFDYPKYQRMISIARARVVLADQMYNVYTSFERKTGKLSRNSLCGHPWGCIGDNNMKHISNCAAFFPAYSAGNLVHKVPPQKKPSTDPIVTTSTMTEYSKAGERPALYSSSDEEVDLCHHQYHQYHQYNPSSSFIILIMLIILIILIIFIILIILIIFIILIPPPPHHHHHHHHHHQSNRPKTMSQPFPALTMFAPSNYADEFPAKHWGRGNLAQSAAGLRKNVRWLLSVRRRWALGISLLR